ncbi:MAG TPA: FAD-dependent oxidoreductase, partial [bacterium]|nr:FAD-dependent oxidoreductase [bacterium]
GTKPVKFSQEEGHPVLTVSSDQSILSQIHADAVLITSGRTVMLDELGLERAGVEYTPKGVITTNTLRTTASNIYACGDVVGPYQLASTAEYQGIIAATNAVLPIKRKAEYHNTVFVACTNPPIAQVGLTEEQALKQYGGDIRMYQFDYGTLRRALADSTPAGLAKIICTKNGAIIGAHILGEAAGEIIHELQIIRAFKKPLHSVYLVSHAYPTYTQAIVGRAAQLAFLDHMQDRFWVKAGLKVMPGLRNKLFLSRYRLAESDEPVPAFQSTETSGQELDVMPSEVPLDERSSRAFLITDDICRVTLPSRLNYFDEQPLLVACEYGAEEKEPNLMLDFSRVECMNGLGASMLVKLANAARLAGRSVAAFGLNRHYRHVLNLTGLDQVIRIYDTQEDALTAYGISLSELPVVTETEKSQPLDVNFWAPPVGILRVPPMPPEARNWNVHGLRPVGPVNGFGQLWQKIYQLRISNPAIRPEEAILALKEHFHRFQPPYNRFYPSAKGIRPGEIILINASTPGGPIATGVMVLYADNNSFTFITPQGHPESGWITFSAFRNSQGTTVVQFLSLARANDPVYEGAFRLTGSKMQVRIWTFLLRALADYLNSRPEITVQEHCVDSTMQWSEAGNIWYNAQIRTLLRMPSLLADKLPKRSRRKQRS